MRDRRASVVDNALEQLDDVAAGDLGDGPATPWGDDLAADRGGDLGPGLELGAPFVRRQDVALDEVLGDRLE